MRAAKKVDASCNDSGRCVQVAHISRCCPPIEREMATLVDAGGGVEADISMLVIGRTTVQDVFDTDPFFSRRINAKDLAARPLISHIRPVAQWPCTASSAMRSLLTHHQMCTTGRRRRSRQA